MAVDAHSPGKCALEQASGCCICNSRLCLEHLLLWQQGWRGSCRAKSSRAGVPSCAMSCSLPPDRNWCPRRVCGPGAAAVMLCQLDHSASACAAVWGSSAGAKQKPGRMRRHGEFLLRAWCRDGYGKTHGNSSVELGAVTSVSESWVGRIKGLSTWTRREVGYGVLNSSWCSAQWGCAGSTLLRAALLSQKTLSELLSPVFFQALLCDLPAVVCVIELFWVGRDL